MCHPGFGNMNLEYSCVMNMCFMVLLFNSEAVILCRRPIILALKLHPEHLDTESTTDGGQGSTIASRPIRFQQSSQQPNNLN